jgi:ribosomal protein S18 acetylase RimI-like enzyme
MNSGPSSLVFRRAAEADIPVLRALANRIWRACYPGIISTEQIDYMLARMYAQEAIVREMADGVVWEVAMDGKTPCGFLACKAERDTGRVKLEKLYLVPELQGRGHGQQLIAQALTVAAALGGRELWLQVNKDNARAQRAYERAGFRIEGEGVFDIGGGFVMDDYLMSRATSRAVA